MPITAPYGSWKSPVTTDQITASSVGLGQIALDGDDVYWVEMRPSEGGRMVIVKRAPNGDLVDITPEPFSVRTKVHEYGGGAFLVADGTVFFSNFSDQRLYRQDPGEEPRPITPDNGSRYADGDYDWESGRIVCVREDHGKGEPVNAIVSVDGNGENPDLVLYDGSDFCSTPRISPDGSTLAWLAWDHPNMPWDGVRLMTSIIYDDGKLGEPRVVAGGDDESIFQPEWSPRGVLHFVSDRSGWWNLYSWDEGEATPLAPLEAEFGKPQWVFGSASYGFVSPEGIVCSFVESGVWKIALLDSRTGALVPIETPYREMGRGDLKASHGRVVFTAGAPNAPMTIFLFDLNTGESDELRRAHDLDVNPDYLSVPEPVEFPTANGKTAHAFYYPPRNPDYEAPKGEKAPLLVKSHGGPTGSASTALDLGIQFWTSRGIGVLDVNYGGSTGYGTEYRRRLNGAWGVVDVEDCANAALHLVVRGDADEARLAIDGGSAGGYTTLASLTFRSVFKAGASYYGVSDLESLAKETHKFESRYLDSLVGPYPECQDLYQERSPINHTHLLSCPIILLQGLDDEIVPPNQAKLMFEAVREKGLPTAYIPFEGEQHGFRRSENIKRALEAELYFYSRVFGFELAEAVTPVEIENLPEAAGQRTHGSAATSLQHQELQEPEAVAEEQEPDEPVADTEIQAPEGSEVDDEELALEEFATVVEEEAPEEPVALVDVQASEAPVALVDEQAPVEPVALVDEQASEEPVALVDEQSPQEPVAIEGPDPEYPVKLVEYQASGEPPLAIQEHATGPAEDAPNGQQTDSEPVGPAGSSELGEAPGTATSTPFPDQSDTGQMVAQAESQAGFTGPGQVAEEPSAATMGGPSEQSVPTALEVTVEPAAPSASPDVPPPPPDVLDADGQVEMANTEDIDKFAEETGIEDSREPSGTSGDQDPKA